MLESSLALLCLAMERPQTKRLAPLPAVIFSSRWLQLPLYLGLIVAQAVYVYHFWVALVHLVEAASGSSTALDTILTNTGLARVSSGANRLTETTIMLVVLGLIDVVMISNLLIMVIVGGYETFVSRLRLDRHPDQPDWLSHVNAGVLKVKLATAIIGISSIHLLGTFIKADYVSEKQMLWQVVIHLAFVASAIAIAFIDRLMETQPSRPGHGSSADDYKKTA